MGIRVGNAVGFDDVSANVPVPVLARNVFNYFGQILGRLFGKVHDLPFPLEKCAPFSTRQQQGFRRKKMQQIDGVPRQTVKENYRSKGRTSMPSRLLCLGGETQEGPGQLGAVRLLCLGDGGQDGAHDADQLTLQRCRTCA